MWLQQTQIQQVKLPPMSRQDYLLGIVFTVLFLFLTNCADGKHDEYLVENKWQRCEWAQRDNCGMQLNCNGTVHYCMTDVKKRRVK